MSLVERALKKLQESRGAVPPPVQIPAQPHIQRAPMQPPQPGHGVEIAPLPAHDVKASAASHRTVLIDRVALRSAEILPPVQQERQLADEYRQIKRSLVANALGRGVPPLANGRLIMVGSALPGDGKTFTSINLALSMALDKDISVVLVDADVAKPHISEIFDLQRERGLLDVLRDETLDVESVILPTDVRGMSVLPAGKHSDTAAELLAGARMQRIVATIGARDPNRIVLFDSPPLLLTSEARALATVVGQIVLVIRAGATSQQAVLDALDLLGEGKSVGLVLNQSDEQSHAGYYQYYGQRDEKTDETA